MESASLQRATVFSFGRVIDDPWNFLVLAHLFTALKGNNLFLFSKHSECLCWSFSSILGIYLIRWLQERQILQPEQKCPKCKTPMKLHQRTNYADGCRWVCQRVDKKHKDRMCHREVGVRVGSFLNARLSLAEMVSLFPFFLIELSKQTNS